MYSEQLESLIQSIIADGVITDKERAVLHKRAEAEGIDADEIDVYTEGLLVQSNKGSIKRMPRRYDKTLLMLETTSYAKYYKLNKSYLSGKRTNPEDADISLLFADITDYSYFEGEHQERNDFYKCICLLISLKRWTTTWHTTIRFMTNKRELFVLRNDYVLSGNGYRLQKQTVGNQEAEETLGYLIDEEQLKLLCETSDIQMASPNEKSIERRRLPGFQYYAQCFYRAIIDPEAYLDSEKYITDAKGEDHKKTQADNEQTEQKMAGLLSRKIKGNRITPTPYFMSQYKILDAVVSDIRGRITLSYDLELEQPPRLYLHAINIKEHENAFYLCLTSHRHYYVDKEIILTVNLQDHILHPITKEESYLSNKNIHKRDKYYNFYYISNDLLKTLLNAKGSTLQLSSEYKIPSIPKKWKKAFEMLEKKDGLKKWKEETGTISKFFQTYFHISVLELIVYVTLFFVILILCFS